MKRSNPAFAAALSCALLAGLLTACGGGGGGAGGGGDPSAMTAPEPAPVTSAPADAFTAAMVALVRSTSDSTEPDDVDGKQPSKPDDREPVAVE